MRLKTSLPLIAIVIAFTVSAQVFAADATKADFEITLKDHKYTPAEIKAPAGKDFTLSVKNTDSTAEEFESHDLGIEKVIAANDTGLIHVHALQAGKYEFVGEYHEASAKGVIIAQ